MWNALDRQRQGLLACSQRWGSSVSCGHRGSAVRIFCRSAGTCFPFTLFPSFSPDMALKLFEGGLSQGLGASRQRGFCSLPGDWQEKDLVSLSTGAQ